MSLRSRLILAFLLLSVVPLTQGYAKAQIELQEGPSRSTTRR